MNFVYIVVGRSGGSFIIKQAVPYVRCIGESWKMTKNRVYYKSRTLVEHGHLCPNHVPEVYHFDQTISLIAMRYLEPPHIILRKGLIAGIEYPLIAHHMSRSLFFTSLLYHTTLEHRQVVAEFCGNVEICRLTEQVIFSDPYKVIDPEFSFYGLMGFDIGAFLGNLILAFFAQDGHANKDDDRKVYKDWILRTIEETWNLFYDKFLALWDEHKDGPGEAYLSGVYNNPKLHQLAKLRFMTDLFHDTLGFGAAKITRRILGVAHVEDLIHLRRSYKSQV